MKLDEQLQVVTRAGEAGHFDGLREEWYHSRDRSAVEASIARRALLAAEELLGERAADESFVAARALSSVAGALDAHEKYVNYVGEALRRCRPQEAT